MITTGVLTYTQLANFERDTPFSVETWLYYPNDRSTKGGIASRHEIAPRLRGWMCYLGSNRNFGFALISDNATSNFLHVITGAALFNYGAWTHVVFTYNGNSLVSGVKCYVNNSLKPLTTVRNTLTGSILNSGPFNSGYSVNTGYLKGSLDELTIYNRALSATEVSQRYNAAAGTESLFGSAYLQYHLNESSGIVVADSSGNLRHATTQNSPTWVAGKLNNCLSFNGVNQAIIGV